MWQSCLWLNRDVNLGGLYNKLIFLYLSSSHAVIFFLFRHWPCLVVPRPLACGSCKYSLIQWILWVHCEEWIHLPIKYSHFSSYYLKLYQVIVSILHSSVWWLLSFPVLLSTGVLNYFKMLWLKPTWSLWVRNSNGTLQECFGSILWCLNPPSSGL